MGLEVVDPSQRWVRRPVLSLLVRAAVFMLPVAAAVAVASALSRALPQPFDTLSTVGWWLSLACASTLVLLALERLARSFLPLASLLDLSLLFPARAPRRAAVARKVGTVHRLEERLAEARAHGVSDDASRAAETILTLVAALQLHDRRTRGHAERVRLFTDLLAEEMGLAEGDRDRLRWAALLHDIGKLAVRAELLNKPDDLTDEDWRELRHHPEAGARYCGALLEWLGPWGDAIAQHHERWDGQGYPHGLAGEDISLGARIVAVPDAYEVMTGARPYTTAMSAQAARDELARAAGTQFDPAVVRAFLNLSIRRLRWLMGPAAWVASLPFITRPAGLTPASTPVATTAVSMVAVVAGPGLTPAVRPERARAGGPGGVGGGGAGAGTAKPCARTRRRSPRSRRAPAVDQRPSVRRRHRARGTAGSDRDGAGRRRAGRRREPPRRNRGLG